MNLAEFKAWLEGYSASFRDGAPNAEQWAEIQKRIAQVQPLSFAPYGPRPDDTMTKPMIIGPYYSPSPSVPDHGWPAGVPIVTC